MPEFRPANVGRWRDAPRARRAGEASVQPLRPAMRFTLPVTGRSFLGALHRVGLNEVVVRLVPCSVRAPESRLTIVGIGPGIVVADPLSRPDDRRTDLRRRGHVNSNPVRSSDSPGPIAPTRSRISTSRGCGYGRPGGKSGGAWRLPDAVSAVRSRSLNPLPRSPRAPGRAGPRSSRPGHRSRSR